MGAPRSTESTYALAEFATGGLLLDLGSGSLFRLNQGASEIWKERLNGVSDSDIGALLSARHGLTEIDARSYVSRALNLDSFREKTSSTQYEYWYERSATGYTFSRAGLAVLLIDSDGERVLPNREAQLSHHEILSAFLAVSPKLIALRGGVVLHASAVLFNGEVIAFSGESGIGKTTTARAFARSDASIFCEDKLVVKTNAERVEAVVGSEAALLAWVRQAADDLAEGRAVSCSELEQVSTVGATVPVREIGFLGERMREGLTIVPSRLVEMEAASTVFCNSFFGSDGNSELERQFRVAAAIAQRLIVNRLAVPDGLEALAAAGSRYLSAIRAAPR